MEAEIMEMNQVHSIAPQTKGMLEVAISRAAQEVQAAMVIAKKFPRNHEKSLERIINACGRDRLAEKAQYAFPRGNETIQGPSIRLAEVLSQCWGNIDSGIIELEQRNGESTIMAYAWDLETNKRATRVFVVKHEREKNEWQNGQKVKVVRKLEGPRDIYEMTANQGARRLRACILEIIPGDVQEEAIEQCNKTLAANAKEPLIDRVKKMVSAFSEYDITEEMIIKRLGHKLESTSEPEMVKLRGIYQSIRDNMADKSEYFDAGGSNVGKSATESLTDLLENKKQVNETKPVESVGKPEPTKQVEPQATPVGQQNSLDMF